ncbi:MAG: carboxypeptidase regulatory-like domain-containing protein, partial [Kofleriaceae bacterium]|nr:carboxypeptidase regulatory-like domain-containing protein [Kofleriaceae bacterium]
MRAFSLIVALLLATVSPLHAQERNLSGRVLDADGNPVAGATVAHLVTEVVTDKEGRFELPVSTGYADIVVVADNFQTL